MTFLWLVLSLTLSLAQQTGPLTEDQAKVLEQARREAERHRQAAMQINELADRIRSEADATALVDAVADIFADSLPNAWLTRGIRHRVARAEYKAAIDPLDLIPEQRVADVWNEYVREIGAPDEAIVTAAEIHSMRDASWAVSQIMWTQGINQSIWTVPNIYALGSDGKVAQGCRALEALRVLYDLENRLDNLRGARERLRKGVVASNEIKQKSREYHVEGRSSVSAWHGAVIGLESRIDPLKVAESQYMRAHGTASFDELLLRSFDELFPPN